ncbi:hypothetical protein MKK68_03830 [Methylobacterium sp. E-016]|uniref:DUF6894 family protein n=1 Tax=Methylobacterium sp. E-016 TaxID=2836556 RepID=UPI001FBBA8DE|nr:hypothetical protein [Methylobacterium sp. E-016]MCJ2074781.1 hypothetical protein [Methylobacterium sp. E-016]
MTRYFFDFYDGETQRDEIGQEYAGPEEAALQAMRSLPEIAKDRVLQDGSIRAFTIAVREELGPTVYTATLTLTEVWIGEDQPPEGQERAQSEDGDTSR